MKKIVSLLLATTATMIGGECTIRDHNIVLAVANTIAHIENTPASWMNPGAIRSMKAPFDYNRYKTEEEGWAALYKRLWRPGQTLKQILAHYAEAPNYVQVILGRVKLTGDTRLCP